ncbi:MAG TPA: universal stress protein [Gammaproteobacteria bacterium]|nr:universal stress protein [Gammaproteobacteria bacterium]
MNAEAYQHVLVPLDVSDEARQVLARARDLATRYGSRLTLLHVVEPVIIDTSYDLIGPLPVEIDAPLLERGRDFLQRIAREFDLGDAKQQVELGPVKGTILEYAKENGVDLIVIGTHGRHGVKLLLGSTANAVLHGTPCDVHAVRIHENGESD